MAVVGKERRGVRAVWKNPDTNTYGRPICREMPRANGTIKREYIRGRVFERAVYVIDRSLFFLLLPTRSVPPPH